MIEYDLTILKNLKENDILVFTVDIEKYDLDFALKEMRALEGILPKGVNIVFFGEGMSLRRVDWEYLRDYVMSIEPKGEDSNG